MKVSSINFPIYSVRDTRMWPCQSVRVQHWLFEWQQPILLDYVARLSAYIVSDETTISECSVDAYAHELSALTIVHTYSTRSLKYACAILTSVPPRSLRYFIRHRITYSSFPFLEFCVRIFLGRYFLLYYYCTLALIGFIVLISNLLFRV